MSKLKTLMDKTEKIASSIKYPNQSGLYSGFNCVFWFCPSPSADATDFFNLLKSMIEILSEDYFKNEHIHNNQSVKMDIGEIDYDSDDINEKTRYLALLGGYCYLWYVKYGWNEIANRTCNNELYRLISTHLPEIGNLKPAHINKALFIFSSFCVWSSESQSDPKFSQFADTYRMQFFNVPNDLLNYFEKCKNNHNNSFFGQSVLNIISDSFGFISKKLE